MLASTGHADSAFPIIGIGASARGLPAFAWRPNWNKPVGWHAWR